MILDGVFNHMSSDSPFFDRYHHYATVGACESRRRRTARGSRSASRPHGERRVRPSTPGGKDTYYAGWFGFDSIPVLNKTDAQCRSTS